MPTEIISQKITRDYLRKIVSVRHGDMVKAVVDISKRIMAIGGELHSDEEKLLIEQGSNQLDLWGVNLWPAVEGDDFIEFDSMINIRPGQGNKSRGIENKQIKETVRKTVNELCS